jgi:hypothetical protein
LIERLPEFISLIVAIRHFLETCSEPPVTECPIGPFHKILSTIMVFKALQRESGNQAGKFVQTGCFNPQVAFLGSEGEAFSRRQGHIEILIEMADVRYASDGRPHADDFSSAEKGTAHRNLIKARTL